MVYPETKEMMIKPQINGSNQALKSSLLVLDRIMCQKLDTPKKNRTRPPSLGRRPPAMNRAKRFAGFPGGGHGGELIQRSPDCPAHFRASALTERRMFRSVPKVLALAACVGRTL